MSFEPLVSIVIPTYNRAAIISRAIQSALDQTYCNREIIVVDDGSSDNTETIVKKFPEVKYIFQNHSGQAAARNNGWKHSSGIYVSTLDSDDVWLPDFLGKCIGVLEKEDLDFVFSNWEQEEIQGGSRNFFASEARLKPYLDKAVDSWVFLEYAQLRDLYVQYCASPSSSLVLRSSSIIQGWNERMNIGDDWCMLLDMILSKETRAAFTTEKLWLKHINCNNIYDGRNHIEVNKLLWVKDFKTILSRHGNILTKNEYNFFEKRYLKNLIRSSKHSLFIYSNVSESLSSMGKALFTNPLYTSKIFSKLFIQAAKRKLKNNSQ
jgi:glycosyltransferase involved in cell wall biosynthesis